MKMQNLVVALAMVSVLTMVSCGSGEKKEVKNEETQVVKGKIVTVGDVKANTVPETVTYNGTIEPLKKNNIASASPLRIDKIFVEVGDKVKNGSIVAEMDKSQMIQQELQLENLATDLTRLEELYKSGGVAKQQVDQLRTQYSVAKKALNYLKENATLRSPINGVVTGRYYDNGDMFSMTPNSAGVVAVVTVMQIDSVKVRVNVSEEYFTKVKNGMDIEINSDSYPDDVFHGKVSLIFPLVDAATHSFTVEVTIPNKDLRLRPGMFTKVDLKIGTKDLVILDDKAVQKQIGSNEKYVYVVKDGVANHRSVIVGRTYNDYTEVISGLEIGEQVVVKGAGRLLDGDKVEVVKQ